MTALEHGADDYMVKPIRPVELLARLEAIVRRGESKPARPRMIDLRALRFNCQTRTAWRDDRVVRLTTKDFDLAVLFISNIGRLLSPLHIRDAVWGPGSVRGSHTLYTHVCHIREKLGLTPPHGWRLAAVYGHGYRLDEIATSPQHIDRQASALAESPWPAPLLKPDALLAPLIRAESIRSKHWNAPLSLLESSHGSEPTAEAIRHARLTGSTASLQVLFDDFIDRQPDCVRPRLWRCNLVIAFHHRWRSCASFPAPILLPAPATLIPA